jgi:hypothetical protein
MRKEPFVNGRDLLNPRRGRQTQLIRGSSGRCGVRYSGSKVQIAQGNGLAHGGSPPVDEGHLVVCQGVERRGHGIDLVASTRDCRDALSRRFCRETI